MPDLANWISAHAVAVVALAAALAVIVLYLVAFGQGRAISFWPPRIEGKPLRLAAPAAGASLSVTDAIKTRKSVRGYADRPVEDEKLNAILEAARLAPSASNRQEWRFVVVRQPETRQKLAQAASSVAAFVGKAPVLIAACAQTDEHVMQCGQLSYPIDVAIAVDHLTLAAVEAGLGTCWVAMFDEQKVKTILGIPAKVRVIALLTLGYPANPSAIEKKRLPLKEIVKYEQW